MLAGEQRLLVRLPGHPTTVPGPALRESHCLPQDDTRHQYRPVHLLIQHCGRHRCVRLAYEPVPVCTFYSKAAMLFTLYNRFQDAQNYMLPKPVTLLAYRYNQSLRLT